MTFTFKFWGTISRGLDSCSSERNGHAVVIVVASGRALLVGGGVVALPDDVLAIQVHIVEFSSLQTIQTSATADSITASELGAEFFVAVSGVG